MVTANDFFHAWVSVMNANKDRAVELWRKCKQFTEMVKNSENSIVSQIAHVVGLNVYERDYYCIDAVFYEDSDRIQGVDSFWLRDICVAFEHENWCNEQLREEASHLLITNSKLKVIVTYPQRNKEEILEFIRRIIEGTRHSNPLSREKNFMIIFGYEEGFRWEGYIYNTKRWDFIPARI